MFVSQDQNFEYANSIQITNLYQLRQIFNKRHLQLLLVAGCKKKWVTDEPGASLLHNENALPEGPSHKEIVGKGQQVFLPERETNGVTQEIIFLLLFFPQEKRRKRKKETKLPLNKLLGRSTTIRQHVFRFTFKGMQY